jgi:hypothetical protein
MKKRNGPSVMFCLPFYGWLKDLKQNKERMIVFDFDKTIIDDARKAYQLFK